MGGRPPFSLRLPFALRQRLEQAAHDKKKPISTFSRELLERGLDDIESGLEPGLTRPEGQRILEALEQVGEVASDSDKIALILAIQKRILAGILFHEGTFLLPELDRKALGRAQTESLEQLAKFLTHGSTKDPWKS